MPLVEAGNGTIDADGNGVGAIEPAVAGAGVDVTSRRRRWEDGSTSTADDEDTAFTTAKRTTRQWPSLPAPPTQPAILSFPGFSPTSNTTTTTTSSSPATNGFYNIQITGTSSNRISLTAVFTTVYETMVQRASLPDRETLTQEWFYTSERSGYVFGIKPPDGSPVGESPPYEAMMGAMSNLPRALQSGRYSVEVMFDVLEGESGERVLQGFLVLDR